MDLSGQLENHEQRIRLSTKATLQATMPGGIPLVAGTHTVGHLPVGALVEGWEAWINGDELFGGDVTLTLGIPSNPTLFFDSEVVADGGISSKNAQDTPVEIYVSNEPLIATIALGGNEPGGVLNMNVKYSEIDTKAGKYTY